MSSARSEAAHILAVDDSPIDQMLITRSSVAHTTKRKKGIRDSGTGENVRTVFTDYWMPDMTGEELLKHLKGSSELKHIPVVIMSSDKSPTRITSCLEEGAMAYLHKPLQMSDVSSLCCRILE